jgi:MFS family permease
MNVTSKRTISAIYASTILGMTATAISGTILVLYAMELGGSIFEVGLVSSAGAYVALALRIPVGALSDRIGRRRILIIGTLSFTVSALLSAFATNAWILILAKLIEGLGWSIFMPVGMALISDVSKDVEALRRYTLSSGIGFFIGPVLSTALLSFLNLRSLFYVSLGFWIIVLTITVMAVREPESQRESRALTGDLSSVIRNRFVLAVILSNIGFSLANMTINTYGPVYLVEELKISQQLIALLASIRSITMVTFRFLSGRMMDRINNKLLLMLTMAILGASGFALSLSQNYFQIAVLMLISGMGWGMIFPLNAITVNQGTKATERGLANATYMSAGDLTTIATPILMTNVIDMWNVRAAFFTSSIMPLIAMTGVYLLLKPRKDS